MAEPPKVSQVTTEKDVAATQIAVAATACAIIFCLGFSGAKLRAGLIVIAVLVVIAVVNHRYRGSRLLEHLSKMVTLGIVGFAAFYFMTARDIGFSLVAITIACLVFSFDSFRRGWRRSALVAVMLSAIFACVSAVEIIMPPGFSVLRRESSRYPRETWDNQWQKGFYEKNATAIGWQPKANAVAKCAGMLSRNDVEWQATYTIDDSGQRTVPSRPASGPKIILLGGSFTFGHGLDDVDTIANRLQECCSEHRVYNCGVNAYGTTQALLTLERVIDDDTQWVFYFSIDNHLGRNGGNAQWMRQRPNTPLLTVDASGELVPRESVLKGLRGKVDRFLNGRSFIYAKLQTIPPWIMPDEWKVDLTTAIIQEMDATCRQLGKQSTRFVVVFLPQADLEVESDRQLELIAKVQNAGIRSLEMRESLRSYFSENPDREWHEMFDVTSRHPTSLHARLIAQACARIVGCRCIETSSSQLDSSASAKSDEG